MHRAEVIAVELFVIRTVLLTHVDGTADRHDLHQIRKSCGDPDRDSLPVAAYAACALPAVQSLSGLFRRLVMQAHVHVSPQALVVSRGARSGRGRRNGRSLV